ncbi:MAG: GNAT family N-acetyltransferase [Bdellovibrionota bacterium]
MSLEAGRSASFRMDLITDRADLGKFSGLLDRAFSVPREGAFLEDFPVWSDGTGPGPERLARLGIYSGSELVSCAGVRLAQLRTPNQPLPVALIGAVATDERYRGHGFASKTVQLAAEWARERGAAVALLWGSEHALYQRLGFDLCGEQVLAALPETSAHEPIHCGWTNGILGAMRKRQDGLLIENVDSAWISAHRNVLWYWTGTAGAVTAYAAVGRGIDLQNVVHEWGGAREQLLGILGRIREDHPEARILGSPRLLENAKIPFDPGSTEFLCMARVLDPKALMRIWHPLTAFDAVSREDGWEVRINGISVPTLSEGELVRFFFGPGAPAFGGLFPLPLWIWGLDAA